MSARWPSLTVDSWTETRDTVQLYLQVVGKVRIAAEPLVNHWWNSTLYLTARGLTTSLVRHPSGAGFQIDLDLIGHRLDATTTDGGHRTMPLEPRSVAGFHAEVVRMLRDLDVPVDIWPVPVELPDAIPFPDDEVHRSYDRDAVTAFWRQLVAIDPVFREFRSRFVGKSSPVHLFFGAMDLAVTRFSGRTAPEYTGSVPNCGPHVMREAYSHEVSSAGFWAGGPGAEGTFYSYAYPEPDGFRTAAVLPEAASWDDDLGEFVLPYEAVRQSADPAATLMSFLQSTYEAAAHSAGWDRDHLERRSGGGPARER